jgi:hypothetical protein
MDDAPSKLDQALECVREVGNAEVGQREAIARAATTLVQSERRLGPPRLEAPAFALLPLVERDVEQRLPEASGPRQIVSGELDQIERHAGSRCGFASYQVIWRCAHLLREPRANDQAHVEDEQHDGDPAEQHRRVPTLDHSPVPRVFGHLGSAFAKHGDEITRMRTLGVPGR